MPNIMILGSAFHVGGAERVIANLAQYLDRGRFNVTLCHLKERGMVGEELVAKGFEVVGIPRVERGAARYLSFLRLAEVVQQRGIELIHTHTTYALNDACLCALLKQRGLKIVHTFHYGNYPHYPMQYKMMERVYTRLADRLVAVGIEQREVIRATYGLQPERIGTIVNGVELPASEPNAEWSARLGSGKVVIGTICTFIEQKGLPDLVEVAAKVCAQTDAAVFVVVGHGPLRAVTEERVRELGLQERILFTGWKPRAAATMLPLFDIFFQPSLWEAMSMVVLEAMAAGKAVVATDVGDNRHVVQHGATGTIIPKRDREAMTTALLDLVRAPDRRVSFGEAGRRRYTEHYDVRSMARAYEDLYLQTLAAC